MQPEHTNITLKDIDASKISDEEETILIVHEKEQPY